uniref:Uncharacterized protein n=1 Tax=Timema bartmani TaxID=61472 RepID=A0A7R9F7D5_9NEOP|nr:unnamed protein product [Timema bartmani]
MNESPAIATAPGNLVSTRTEVYGLNSADLHQELKARNISFPPDTPVGVLRSLLSDKCVPFDKKAFCIYNKPTTLSELYSLASSIEGSLLAEKEYLEAFPACVSIAPRCDKVGQTSGLIPSPMLSLPPVGALSARLSVGKRMTRSVDEGCPPRLRFRSVLFPLPLLSNSRLDRIQDSPCWIQVHNPPHPLTSFLVCPREVRSDPVTCLGGREGALLCQSQSDPLISHFLKYRNKEGAADRKFKGVVTTCLLLSNICTILGHFLSSLFHKVILRRDTHVSGTSLLHKVTLRRDTHVSGQACFTMSHSANGLGMRRVDFRRRLHAFAWRERVGNHVGKPDSVEPTRIEPRCPRHQQSIYPAVANNPRQDESDVPVRTPTDLSYLHLSDHSKHNNISATVTSLTHGTVWLVTRRSRLESRLS